MGCVTDGLAGVCLPRESACSVVGAGQSSGGRTASGCIEVARHPSPCLVLTRDKQVVVFNVLGRL